MRQRDRGAPMNRDQMEARRLAAIPDLRRSGKGYTGKLSSKYGVSRTTISRWRRALFGGLGLRKRPTPGRPRELADDRLPELERVYRNGPRAQGWDTERWTGRLFAEVIRRRFGVSYSPDHALRCLYKFGFAIRGKK